MTRYALNIGINYANPHDFADAQLDGAVHDALTLNDFTTSRGFQPASMKFAPSGALTDIDENGQLPPQVAENGGPTRKVPTAANIFDAITEAAGNLMPEDLLFVSFSGLGPPPDFADPNAANTRGLLCFDRIVLRFDDIVAALSKAPGGKIVLVCACCFIGPGNMQGFRRTARTLSARAVQTASALKQAPTYYANTAVKLEELEKKRKGMALPESDPFLLHIAACDLDQVIDDGTRDSNSPFVGELLKQLREQTLRPFDAFAHALQALNPEPQFEFFLKGKPIQSGQPGLAAAKAQFDGNILDEPAGVAVAASVSWRK